jgi:hypothetical protein
MRSIWQDCGNDMHGIRTLFSVFTVGSLARSYGRCRQAQGRTNRGFFRGDRPVAGYVLSTRRSLLLTMRRIRHAKIQLDLQEGHVVIAYDGSTT